MIEIKDKSLCCGCEVCAKKCPKHCIQMREDELGFLYPHVELKSCINCGLCEKVCPVINQSEEQYPTNVYACKNIDEEIRLNSSSGGLFTAIATKFIQKGGVVFGVKFDKDWNVVFSYTTEFEGLKEFQGSKYTQAYVGDAYTQVEAFLKDGKEVLFTGTSCQIAGLKRYLQKDYGNLYTIDFICHGVPNQKLFKTFIKEEIQKHSRTSSHSLDFIKEIKFRSKKQGWKRFCFILRVSKPVNNDTDDVVISSVFSNTSYGKFFLNDLSLRPSCYNCPAKSGKSCSDLTMADFWGVQKFYPEFDDDKGITLAIVNKLKGDTLIPFDKLHYIKPSFEEAFDSNGGYFRSVPFQPKKTLFWEYILSGKDLCVVHKLLFPIPMKTKIKRAIKKLFRIN